MNNINYTGKWSLDISNMSEAEWDQLVIICKMKGVRMYSTRYKNHYKYLEPEGDCIGRHNLNCTNTVTLLQMLNLLETPIKSPSQIKIEELQATIKLANDQIEALKEL